MHTSEQPICKRRTNTYTHTHTHTHTYEYIMHTNHITTHTKSNLAYRNTYALT